LRLPSYRILILLSAQRLTDDPVSRLADRGRPASSMRSVW